MATQNNLLENKLREIHLDRISVLTTYKSKRVYLIAFSVM